MSDSFQEKPKKGFVPTQQGYNDRKMAKWDGFILSDHAELQNKAAAKRHKVNMPKEEQSLIVVSEHLNQAFSQKCPVCIQLDVVADGLYGEDITGTVCGFDEEQIYIQTADDRIAVELESIRHVSFLSMVKWFKQDS